MCAPVGGWCRYGILPMENENKLCRHFGDCGGCLYQELSYQEQLAQKEHFLKDLLQDYWKGPIQVVPSPVLFHYRNKIDPGFALKRYPEPPPPNFKRETVLGFKARRGWKWPIELEECLIGPEGVSALLDSLAQWRPECGMEAYDNRKGTGRLRNLLVRDGKRSGEKMVVLITTPGPLADADAFVAAVLRGFDATSIFHGEFSGGAEVATADNLTLLHGNPWITETLQFNRDLYSEDNLAVFSAPDAFINQNGRNAEKLNFRISPLSFFQTNPLAAERLYGLIRKWVQALGPEHLYDLYGGAGGIALSCSRFAGSIISVENVSDASEDGRFNARENGIDNVAFVTDTVRAFTKKLLVSGGMPPGSAVILDPPRAGMHPKSIARLVQMAPRHVLYVSCNPKKLREELAVLGEAYRVTDLKGVDMFPHTPHVEVLASLEASPASLG